MSDPKTYYPVATMSELQEFGRKIVQVKQIEVGLFLVNGQVYAWRNICPHGAAPVCEGVVCGTRLPSLVYEYEYGKDREIVRCPWHGWEFDLKTGKHLVDERTALRGYEIKIEGDDVYILV